MANENKSEQLPEEKMTIYDYEQKYVKRQNVRGAKFVLRLLTTVVAVAMFACLFMIVLKVWGLHMYAGIAAAVLCALLYIFLFIVPIVKIFKSDYFIVNVNAYTAKEAQKHNKKLRHDIADKIIDFTATVDGVGWYDSKVVGELAIALKAGNEKGITQSLTKLYGDSVKKSAKDLITKAAVKSGMYSAISQTNKIDAALVAFVNIQLVKDLVFLYGFRPSDPKLLKIFSRVLQNSLIAYGVGGLRLGNSIVQTMGNAVKSIPLLGSAISTIVDSSVQGLTNGVLTAVIGYQTIKYLNDEYKLQEILDGIEVAETEEELKETCVEIEQELKGATTRRPPKATATT
jgi:uncharacterized membrane protein YcjF (UPF0283 family)